MRQNPQAPQLEAAVAQELPVQLLALKQGAGRGVGSLQEGVIQAPAADQICLAGQGRGLLVPTVSPNACAVKSRSSNVTLHCSPDAQSIGLLYCS